MRDTEYETYLIDRCCYSPEAAAEVRDSVGAEAFALVLAVTDNVGNLDELDDSLHAVAIDIGAVIEDLDRLGYVITRKEWG